MTAPGVGPDVTGVAHGALPADGTAVVVTRVASTVTSAVSVRFWSSVTIRRSVMEPEVGTITVALAVFAPTTAGGFVAGRTTTQANEVRLRPQAAALAAALSTAF